MKTNPEDLRRDEEHLRLKRVVLPIVATSKNLDLFEPIGTAFIIRSDGKQAIALTAAHNIHEIAKIDCPYDHYHPTTLPEFRLRETEVNLKDTAIRILYPDKDGQIHTAYMTKAYALDDSDIAVCVLQIGAGLPLSLVFDQQLRIDSRAPQKGASILALGYKEMKVPRHTVEGNHATVEFSEILVRRTGTISEVYPTRGPRGQKMPCFECTVPFDNGMSGGPVIELSDEGSVAIGVISSDISFEYPHRGSGTNAIASIIWPAMGVKLAKEKLKGVTGPALVDFEERGLIVDRGKSHSHLRFNDDRTAMRWV